jgi:hypothetical protein
MLGNTDSKVFRALFDEGVLGSLGGLAGRGEWGWCDLLLWSLSLLALSVVAPKGYKDIPFFFEGRSL